MAPLTICLWKWKPNPKVDIRRSRVPYTNEHVEKMCSMLAYHLTIPYRVVLFTDDPTGAPCETQPLPAAELLRYGACWNRLWLFSSQARQIGRQLVSIDLDTVLVDNCDALFQDLPPFKIWRGSYPGIPYCGSLWTIRAGAFPWVWEQFDPKDLKHGGRLRSRYEHPDCLTAGHRIGSDQAWMALKLPNMPVWTSADGVVSYRLEAKGELPLGARLVNFHGLEDPSLPQQQAESPWIKVYWR